MSEQQLEAYVAWVNSQLRKRPGSRIIEDLKSDMRDGVAFIYLIEIVAGEVLPDVWESPSNSEEMIANIEKVLKFMRDMRIKMHHTLAQDIVDGNLKSIMRLILALAAHFKPDSVRQTSAAASAAASPVGGGATSSHGATPARSGHPTTPMSGAGGARTTPVTASPHRRVSSGSGMPQNTPGAGSANTTFTGIAHDAAAALARGRIDAIELGQRVERPKHLMNRYASGSDSSETSGDATHRPQLHPRTHAKHHTGGGAGSLGEAPPPPPPHHLSQQHLRSDTTFTSHQYPPPRHHQPPQHVSGGGGGHQQPPYVNHHNVTSSLHTRSQSHHTLGRYELDNVSAASSADGHLSGVGGSGTMAVHGGASAGGTSSDHTSHSARGSLGSTSSYSGSSQHDGSPPTHRRMLDYSGGGGGHRRRDSGSHSSSSDRLTSSSTARVPKSFSHDVISTTSGCEVSSTSSTYPPSPTHDPTRDPAFDPTMHNSEAWVDLLTEHTQLVEELRETKQTLVGLQQLLLHGSTDDDDLDAKNESVLMETDNDIENIVIYRSKLQQCEEVCNSLREELSQYKNECMQLRGSKSVLQKKANQLDKSNCDMRSEILRIGAMKDALLAEKELLESHSQDKDAELSSLRHQVSSRDHEIERLVKKLAAQQQDKERATQSLRLQITDLHQRLQKTTEAEKFIAAKINAQDDAMNKLEQQMRHNYGGSDGNLSHPASSSRSGHSSGDELQQMRDSIRSLRLGMADSDAHQHIDQLEQSISALMTQMHLNENNHGRSGEPIHMRGRLNYDSTGDIRRSPIANVPGYPPQSAHRDGSTHSSTKVLYFTDRTVTPFKFTIDKKLGDIKLKDFKKEFDRPGIVFRYHFKAMDLEFGTVKEEITDPEGIIPGFEGKIVAWIEEDHG